MVASGGCPPLDPCPNDDTLARFAAQTMDSAALDALASHLRECEGCDTTAALLLSVSSLRSSLARGATTETLAAFEQRVAFPTQLLSAGALGRFRLLRCIGRGAMGVVFAAHDPELDRPVAIKVLTRGSSSVDCSGQRGRLLAEARSMAKLQHPHVVTAYETGVAGEHVFLAMELVEGPTLDTWCAGERSVAEVADLFCSVARAVHAAHAAGIIHRDLKPKNILVSKEGQPKVTDFGLAGTSVEACSTDAVGLVGTPAYMAPEVLRGATPGTASDQFALAACLHEALAGVRPYPAASLDELRDLARSAPTLAKAIPRRLRPALRRALAYEPAARFPSVGAFGAALHEAAAPRHARRAAILATAIVIAVVVAGLVRARSFPGEAARAQQLAPVSVAPAVASESGRGAAQVSSAQPADHAVAAASAGLPGSTPPTPKRTVLAPSRSAARPAVVVGASSADAPASPPSAPEETATRADWLRSRR